MSQDVYQGEQGPAPEKNPGRQRQHLLGVVYRLVIIFGLIFLVVGFILVVFTAFIPYWFLIFPVALIIIGILLARIEYTLHMKLNRKE